MYVEHQPPSPPVAANVGIESLSRSIFKIPTSAHNMKLSLDEKQMNKRDKTSNITSTTAINYFFKKIFVMPQIA
jgi:hypothetical protein